MRRLLPILALLALVPATASAVTVKEIVSLSKAGVSEQVILALIDRDKTIFTLQADEIVTLLKEGLTDAILVAMLRSGRSEPVPPPAPVAALPPEPTEPTLSDVGQEADRPIAQPIDNRNADAGIAPGVPYGVPYYVPVPYVVASAPARSRCVVQATMPPAGLPPASVPPANVSASTGIFFRTPAAGMFFPKPASVRVDCLPGEPRRPSQRR